MHSDEKHLNSYPSKYSIGYGSNGSIEIYNDTVRTKVKQDGGITIHEQKPEEEDFEELAMPTDDEGITNSL